MAPSGVLGLAKRALVTASPASQGSPGKPQNTRKRRKSCLLLHGQVCGIHGCRRSTLKTPTDLHSKLRRMVSRLRRGACNRLVRRQRQRVERHKQLAVGACTQHGHVTNKHAYQTRACRDRHIALASTTQRGMAPSSTAHSLSLYMSRDVSGA